MRQLLVSCILLSLATSVSAEEPFPVQRAIVFKSGVAWVEHRTTVPLSDGWGALPIAPAAIFGTVSLTSPATGIAELHAENVEDSTRPVASLDDLLRANRGKNVTIRTSDRTVTGRLVQVPERSDSAAAAEPRRDAFAGPANAEPLLFLDTGSSVIAISRMSVQSVELESPNYQVQHSSPRLRFRTSTRRDGSIPVTLGYMRRGVGWLADYSIELRSDSAAHLAMQATLINDGAALQGADVQFAVGFPNFAFSTVPSPLSLEQTLAQFYQSLERRGTGSMAMANVAVQQSLAYSAEAEPAVIGPDSTSALGGEGMGDLFFYSAPNVTLQPGERASFAVFEAEVPYRDIYVWEIPAEQQTNQQRFPPSEAKADQVWHSIELTNSTQYPWTTAPAIIFSGGRPLAQETLHYTPAGAGSKVRLTVATDISVSREELETSRQENALQRFGYQWDTVTVSGKLQIRNLKRQPVTLTVGKTVEGEVIERAAGKVSRLAAEPRAINPAERIEWELPLAAGESRTIEYRYKVHVRN